MRKSRNKLKAYKKAEIRGVITDGLSEEALHHINKTINKTTKESGYQILDKHGLMPENIIIELENGFGIKNGNKTINLVQIENGIFKSEDGRIKLLEDQNGSYIVSYDFNDVNGHNRTATYKVVNGLGLKKTGETISVNNGKTKLVSINKDFNIEKRTIECEREVENKNKKWWEFLKDSIVMEKFEHTYYSSTYNISICVNTEDNYAYSESSTTSPFGYRNIEQKYTKLK